MKVLIALVISTFGFSAIASSIPQYAVSSPKLTHTLGLNLSSDGVLHGCILCGDRVIVKDLTFGNVFQDGGALKGSLVIDSVSSGQTDENYTVPAGKNKSIRNHYNYLIANLSEADGLKRRFAVEFRVYDDGAAFRYVFPEQPALKDFVITEELTTFVFGDNHTCWASTWNRFNNSNETEYLKTRLNALDPKRYIQRPITIQCTNGIALCLYEANLADYAGLFFQKVAEKDNTLKTVLTPRIGVGQTGAVKASTPHRSPWRVIQIAEKPADLIESDLVLNLSEPCRIKDTSWVVPGKAIFPWWPNFRTDRKGVASKNSYENQQDYIDFASENGIKYLELEPQWYETAPGVRDGKQSPENSDPLKPLKHMRIQELIKYARSKNVGVFLWIHWTLLVDNIDQVMETYKSWGAVGMKVDFFDRNDQEMVNIYHEIAQKAAKHELMVFYHGAYTPAGLRRTWPNLITREGVLGNEYNKWSKRITLEHTLTIPFTRMVPGPMDYTPGGFRNVTGEDFKRDFNLPLVMGTRCRQLAMFVVYESPLQMVCDYPGAYQGQKGLDFLAIVPASWDQSRCLAGEIGEYIVIARRKADKWYIGGMTDEKSRTIDIPLGFLKDNAPYSIESWNDTPSGKPATELFKQKLNCIGGADKKLSLRMTSGGGTVLIITPAR